MDHPTLQGSRWQVIASGGLLALWTLFLLMMAVST
jgi:hypothetical protein